MTKPVTLQYFTDWNNLSFKEEQQQAVFALAKELNSSRGIKRIQNMNTSAVQIDFDEAHEDIVCRLGIDNAQWSYTNRLAQFYAGGIFTNINSKSNMAPI